MYAKIFASLYQGTLRGCADPILVFTNLLAHCDSSGVVDMHPRAISDETGISVERVQAAIQMLESPDPDSRSAAEEGRRIIRLDGHRTWGWRVVNHGKYRAIRSEDDRREQNRKAQKAWRERQKTVIYSKPSVSEGKTESAENQRPSAESAQAEAEAEAEAVNRHPPLTDSEIPTTETPIRAADFVFLNPEAKANPAGPTRAAQIAILIRSIDKRDKRPSRITSQNPELLGWAEDPRITDALLAEAYDLAVAQRVAVGDASGIPASYLAPIVQRLLNPPKPRYDRSWRFSEASIDQHARKLGVTAMQGEGYKAFADRLELIDRARSGVGEVA
jgi:hypothetical protein